VYENLDRPHTYRESDRIGGRGPLDYWPGRPQGLGCFEPSTISKGPQ
jgi:hypothetical protein